MAKRNTAQIANSDLMGGDKLYLQRARLALPYLVRQAKAGKTIYYSDLAELINISNPRNLNYILGSIGNTLIELSKREKTIIPPIQCIVINKSDELPGEGVEYFISPNVFNKLTKTQKQKVLETELTKIFTFQNWDWVLKQLELEPIITNLGDKLEQARNIQGGGGESELHRKFKEFISENPNVLGLSGKLQNGIQEYKLPSADTIDVLFTDKGLRIGVEVKSIISGVPDILRGLFQCVKYKCLIEADQIVNDEVPNSRIILALEGQLPEELILVKNLLGIEVIDQLNPSE